MLRRIADWIYWGLIVRDWEPQVDESEYELDRYDDSLGHNQRWVWIHSIEVGNERDKAQLLEALRYLHDHPINTEFMAVNALVHLYRNPEKIKITLNME